MPELIIKFTSTDAAAHAEEFQRHLEARKTTNPDAKSEKHEKEVWVTIGNVDAKLVREIVEEAKPWCLDRGLGLMQAQGEPESEANVVIIADLFGIAE